MPDKARFLAAAREKLDREDFEGALEDLQKIREVDANSVEVLHEKAYAYLGLRQPDKALECYDAAVVLGNVDADLWNDRGFVLHGLGRHKEAVESARRALELDPHHYAALCNSVNAFFSLGENEKALAMADRAVKLNPLEEEGLFLRAEAFRHLERRQEAIDAYEKVLKVNPHNSQARNRLEQLERYRNMDKVRRWDARWEKWSGLERLPFVIGFLLPGILLVALGALVPTIKGGNVLLFRAISISVGVILILISAAVMLSGRKGRRENGPDNENSKHDKQEQAQKRFKGVKKSFKDELEEKVDSKMERPRAEIKKDFARLEGEVEKLKSLREQLDSLDTTGFEADVNPIRTKIRDMGNSKEIEADILKLKLKIEKKQEGHITNG